MNKKKTVVGIGIAIAFQLVILIGEYVSASTPLWLGEEVRIKTIPVDPRSMFRGNYARLRYEMSEIPTSELERSETLRNGEVVYLQLKMNDRGLYEYDKAFLDAPNQGVFIRGRIVNRRYDEDAQFFRLKFGIEAYFAPKEKALALEKKLREGGVAVLMIANSGKAALKDVVVESMNDG